MHVQFQSALWHLPHALYVQVNSINPDVLRPGFTDELNNIFNIVFTKEVPKFKIPIIIPRIKIESSMIKPDTPCVLVLGLLELYFELVHYMTQGVWFPNTTSLISNTL